jgi:hypothetical protein
MFLDPERNRRSGRGAAFSCAWLPFPAFQHYRLDAAGALVEVGRSHWRGDPWSGQFDIQVGQLIPRFALMLMTLIKSYAMRANFRSYSYRDEMESDALAHLCRTTLALRAEKPEPVQLHHIHHASRILAGPEIRETAAGPSRQHPGGCRSVAIPDPPAVQLDYDAAGARRAELSLQA